MFTCGLMKDPTPLVEHVYENYIELVCNAISPGFIETESRLLAQGKDMGDTSLFNLLYSESRVPLIGHALHNQFVYIIENNENCKREIVTPSQLYEFVKVSEDDVPVTKFNEHYGSEEERECVFFIQKPDAAAIKSLLLTCWEISKRQPVTHLIIDDVTCEDMTHTEVLALSRNVQVVCVMDCYFPVIFWKNILHQLFDCVSLYSLWFANTNLHQLEEDLDELFEHLNRNTALTSRQVEVELRENNFSEKFVNKWNGSRSGITCNFDNKVSEYSDQVLESIDEVSEYSDQVLESIDEVSEYSEEEDEFSLEEINQLLGEQAQAVKEINLSQKDFELKGSVGNDREIVRMKGDVTKHHLNRAHSTESSFSSGKVNLLREYLSSDLVTAIKMSQPQFLSQLIVRDCIIAEDKAFEAMMSLPIYKFLSILDFGGTKLGFNARHMKNIPYTCHLREICLSDCQIPPPVCGHLFSAMSKCTKITHLNMAWNKIHMCGLDLAETILAWGVKSVLKELDLSHCEIPSGSSKYLLSALGSCLQLTILWLPGNTLTGSLPRFIPDPHDGLHSLEELFLNYTGLSNRDLLHLIDLVKKRKLSRLKELDLGANSLYRMADVLEHLMEVCVTNYQHELKLCIWFNNMSTAAEDKFKILCNNTNIKLCTEREDAFQTGNTDTQADTKTQMNTTEPGYAWKEDEFLQGFYNDVDVDEVDEE